MVTKMDVKNLEIRSKSVEQTLMPLMSQVSISGACSFLVNIILFGMVNFHKLLIAFLL